MKPRTYKSLDELLRYAPLTIDHDWLKEVHAQIETLQGTISALGGERDLALEACAEARMDLSLYLDLHDLEETPFCTHSKKLRTIESSLVIDERNLTNY